MGASLEAIVSNASPGAGWLVAVSLGLLIIRKLSNGEWVPKARHDEIVSAAVRIGDRALNDLDRLVETHGLTVAQLGEAMEAQRFTRAVMEAVDQRVGGASA